MRRLLLVILGIVAASAWLAAQHDNTTEERGSGVLMVPSEVVVGTHVLPAGEYFIVCDRTKITFTRVTDNRTVLQAICKGRHLPSASTKTEMTTIDDKRGGRHVVTLLLSGSNVEHVFK